MLYNEIIAVCSQIYAEHINTLCGQNVECRTYRAVNTPRLVNKNQSVNAVQWNNRSFYWDPYKTNTLCGQSVEFLVFNLAVRIVTIRVQRVKRCWRLELNVPALLPLDREWATLRPLCQEAAGVHCTTYRQCFRTDLVVAKSTIFSGRNQTHFVRTSRSLYRVTSAVCFS